MSSSFSLRSLGRTAVSVTSDSFLVHRPAAVDHDGLAGDEGGGVAGEEGDQVPDILRGAAALEGLLFEDAAVERLLVRVDPLCVGREGAWGDSVDGDALGPDLAGERAGKADDPAFGGDVVEEARPADKEGYGGDVDDAAVSALPHVREGCPGAQEVALQVHGHHPVPLLFFDLRPRTQRVDGRVVHEDVYAAELGRYTFSHRLHGSPVGDVCL